MASEFDESLQNFLLENRLRMEIVPVRVGVLRIVLVPVDSRDGPVAESWWTYESLDYAINLAVDAFEAKGRAVTERRGAWQTSADLEPNAEQCPCESEACERAGRHRAGECPHQADPELQVEYLGALCRACYEQMPEEYRKNDELPLLRRHGLGYTTTLGGEPDAPADFFTHRISEEGRPVWVLFDWRDGPSSKHIIGEYESPEEVQEAVAELRRLEPNGDDLEPNRVWTTRYKNSLPDSAFLHVVENCVEWKDDEGRSHPLSCRVLPYRNRAGNLDEAHLKNAISRAVQLGPDVSKAEQKRLQAKARRLFKSEFGYASED